MLDGLKLMVRWSQLDVAAPVFGMVETTAIKVIVLVAMGAVSVVAGAMLLAFAGEPGLRRRPRWPFPHYRSQQAGRCSDEAIAQVQVARREAQGLPLREGEIEAMQSLLPVVSAGMLAVTIILLLLCRERQT